MADVILQEQQMKFAYDDVYKIYSWSAAGTESALFALVSGERYIVTWDGVSYTCEASNMSLGDISGVGMGNKGIIGGENSGEPFIFAYVAENLMNAAFSMDTAETTHTVSITKYEETPVTPEKQGVDIVLYDRTGSAVTYSGVDTITTDTPTDGETATFTYGKVVEGTEIDLALADGDQTVSVPAGSLVREATIKKPETLTPEHIKKGVDVAGVVGTFAGDEMEKTVDLNMANGDQIVDADPDTVMTRVTVKKPETLVPGNIVKGANIGGVIGTHTGEFGIYTSGGNGKTWIEPEHIAGSMFTHNETFTKESFPNVLDVGGYAFYSASNLTGIDMPLCESVGDYAFAYCSKLKDVNMPNCKSLGSYAFFRCSSLEKAYFPNCISIGNYTFQACGGIKELSFPAISELSTIATTAFNFPAYSGLVARFDNVTFIPGSTVNPLRTLSGYLTELYAPKCTAVSVYGLSGFSKLSKIVMSKSENSFSTWGCYNCSSLEGIYTYSEETGKIINAYIKPSGTSCFAYCSSLKSISIQWAPYGGIGSYAFMNCINLESLGVRAEETGLQVEYIRNGAFLNCHKIPKFSIGLKNSTEKLVIGSSAFYGCSMLSQLYINVNIWSTSSNLSSLGANAFANTPMSNSSYLGYYGSIYVPSSMLAWFQTKIGWSLYSERMVGY